MKHIQRIFCFGFLPGISSWDGIEKAYFQLYPWFYGRIVQVIGYFRDSINLGRKI